MAATPIIGAKRLIIGMVRRKVIMTPAVNNLLIFAFLTTSIFGMLRCRVATSSKYSLPKRYPFRQKKRENAIGGNQNVIR